MRIDWSGQHRDAHDEDEVERALRFTDDVGGAQFWLSGSDGGCEQASVASGA